MTFGSLFAGIGGIDLGFERNGMRGLWQVEIDAQCRRVLAKRFPYAERLPDVSKVGKRTLPRVDVICGGFPCQDLSVAGQRKGFKGERSSLFFEFARIVKELRPELVIFENVPGLLSSDAGRDSLMVLRVFADLDFHGGWRVLDSQYFGVAQRRKRVFGCFACGRFGAGRAAEILAFTKGWSRRSQASNDKKKTLARTIRSRSHGAGVSAPGRGGEDDDNLVIAAPITAGYHKGAGVNDGKKGSPQNLIVVSHTLNGKRGKRYDGESETFIASTLPASNGGVSNGMHPIVTHSLSCEGADASEDGTGRGTPLVVVPIDMRQASRGDKMTNNRRAGTSGGAPGTGIGEAGEHCPTLADTHTPAIAGVFGVRRLMPIECLRLQGFPDDWLDLSPPLSDSAKYRMIGNAVTVNVAEWLGKRIVRHAQ